MITLTIADGVRTITKASDIEASWINQQIRGATQDLGHAPCVKVQIASPGITVGLVTARCQVGGGGGRPPNPQEADILRAWERHVDQNEPNAGGVVAFLQAALRIAAGG